MGRTRLVFWSLPIERYHNELILAVQGVHSALCPWQLACVHTSGNHLEYGPTVYALKVIGNGD